MTNDILTKLLDIEAELGPFEKNGKGPSSQGSYPFLQVDDIIEQLKGLMVKHRVLSRPRMIEHESRTDFGGEIWTMGGWDAQRQVEVAPKQTRDGRVPSIRQYQWGRIDFTFVSATDGSEFSTIVSGEALDSQDKATRKMWTAAWKQILLIVFNIHTGEDPDAIDGAARAENPASNPAPAEKKSRSVQNAEAASVGSKASAPHAVQDARVADIPDDTPVDKLKAMVRAKFTELGVPAPEVIAFGSKLTDKKQNVWMTQVSEVRKVLNALERPDAVEYMRAYIAGGDS